MPIFTLKFIMNILHFIICLSFYKNVIYLHAYLIIILQFLSKKMFPHNYNNLFPSTTSPSYSIYLIAYR